MGKNFRNFDLDDDPDDFEDKPVPVVDLPYYETLRAILEPYTPVDEERHADKTFSSTEIINAIEEHHGVPQGPAHKGSIVEWVEPDDFVRAMKYCGFKAVNGGGLSLVWLMKKK
jgi:hypothetical protein